jgi:hypothetical protein
MADKHVTFFPVNVEEAYEAIHRCLLQYRAEGSRFSADETTLPSPGGGQRYNNRRGSGLVDANAAFSNNPHGAQALTKSHDARMAEETTTGVFEQLLDQAKCETYKAGDVIIENGTRHCTLFNVASGSVAVQVQRLNEDTQLMEPVKVRRRRRSRRRRSRRRRSRRRRSCAGITRAAACARRRRSAVISRVRLLTRRRRSSLYTRGRSSAKCPSSTATLRARPWLRSCRAVRAHQRLSTRSTARRAMAAVARACLPDGAFRV